MDRKEKTSHTRDNPVHSSNPRQNQGRIYVNPEFDGIFLQNLKKGDLIRVETAPVEGLVLVIDMELIDPRTALVAVTRIRQRNLFHIKHVEKSAIGLKTAEAVVRCHECSKKTLTDGYLGVGCQLFFGSTMLNQTVARIFINGKMFFPMSSTVH